MEMQIANPPRTAMQVFKMLPEGTLAEVINNQLLMAASPFGVHQRLLASLSTDIVLWLRENHFGELFFAPMDVYLDEVANAVQPDIFILQHGGEAFVNTKGFVHGSPAIIIEILSVGNQDHDKIVKKNLYERFGVQEYFIVDPDRNQSFIIGYRHRFTNCNLPLPVLYNQNYWVQRLLFKPVIFDKL